MIDENKTIDPVSSQTAVGMKVVDIGKKLKDILDDVLSVGDWDSSIFLKASAVKLKVLKSKLENLYCNTGSGKAIDANHDHNKTESLAGSTRVFILLYQIDGADLQGWDRTIKTLVEYGVTRPAYKNEDHARELVRSKVTNIERNGYVIANIKDGEIYQAEQQVDVLGNQLFALRENAIKLENIVEFVHANKKRYLVQNNELVFLSEI